MFRIFPDVHVDNDPYPIQFGSDDWITVITRATGTLILGLRTCFLAQGHRFFPRTVMALMTGKTLTPSPAARLDGQQAGNHGTRISRLSDVVPAGLRRTVIR